MPNWCENELYIMGNDCDIKHCLGLIAGDNGLLDFNKIIPYPKIFNEIDELAGVKKNQMFGEPKEVFELPDEIKEKLIAMELEPKFNHNAYNSWGYNWCAKNWATKWNAAEIEEDTIVEHGTVYLPDTDDEITCFLKRITFNTAWSPPLPVIEALAKQFPKLTFWLKYWEQGCGFKGEYAACGESIIADETTHYNGMMDPTDPCRGG